MPDSTQNKAFLDLTERREKGEHIDSDDIRKHKNDVFRIAQILVPDSKHSVSEKIRGDIRRFIDAVGKEPPELKKLGIKGASVEEIIKVFIDVYGL